MLKQDQNITTKIIANLFWKLMERGGTQGIQLIVQIVLARLLLPEDYGIMALVLVFIAIANVFVQSGLNTALIQKKDADEADFSSVFYLNLFIAGLIYIILFLIAPFIAAFYEEPELLLVFRVLSISLFFCAVNSLQEAVIARRMQFKKLFLSSIGAILASGTIGIYMAYMGFGVWALVGQYISNQLLITVILWFTVKWRPKLLFSTEKVRSLFSFGWKILVASLIDTIYRNLRNLIVGKMYNAQMLGFYNRGEQFPALIITNINGSIQSVLFPVLASQQDNRLRVKELMRRSIVMSSFLIFPMMVGLAVTAEPLVKLLLTDKWLPCVPFLQIFCAGYALWPIHTANLQAINASGRSGIFLKIEIVKKIVGLTILAVTMLFGIYAIAFGEVFFGIIATFINAYPNKKLLNYNYIEQWNDIMPYLLLSLLMGAVIYLFKCVAFSPVTTVIIQVSVGVIFYLSMARLLKLECFNYLTTLGRYWLSKSEGR